MKVQGPALSCAGSGRRDEAIREVGIFEHETGEYPLGPDPLDDLGTALPDELGVDRVAAGDEPPHAHATTDRAANVPRTNRR